MAIVTNCPDCGKRAKLSDAQAGMETLCAACGKPIVVPRPPGAPALNTLHPIARAAAARNWGVIYWMLASAAAALIVLLCGLFLYDTMTQSAIARNRTAAAQMNADAQALVRSHRLSEASAKYHEVLEFISSRELSDPELSRLAQDVRHDEDRVEQDLSQQSASAKANALAAAVPTRDADKPDEPVTVAPSPKTVESGPATSAYVSAQVVSPKPLAAATRPAVQAMASNDPPPTDQQIGAAIQQGVDYLISRFDPDVFELRDGLETRNRRRASDPSQDGADAYHNGADTLCVYALMQCGEAINDPRLNPHNPFMAGCIEAMKAYSLNDHFGTYTRGLRASALALNNRKEDRKVLAEDVAELVRTNIGGAYSYYSSYAEDSRDNRWDNSNSQYGLLGVWSGAEADIPVPTSYWFSVEKHWTSTQVSNGQWSYRDYGGPLWTMTCAGVASLFVCHDWLDAPKFGNDVGREPFSPALKKGLDWLEQGDRSVTPMGDWGYSMYSLERAGLASGFKFFGAHNWYPELALQVLRQQNGANGWIDDVNTAYALLFLSRGRHPVVMNKLRFSGYWANRPRDACNLATFASHELEHPINWQVVPLAANWTDWVDSPILYLASHVPPPLGEADIDKIRQFVLAGGMLFVQADGDAPAMTRFAQDLSHQLFPQYSLTDVPQEHPLFTSDYKLSSHPPLRMVSNGSRILMLFSPTDISHHWQLRDHRTEAGKLAFQLGINMFVYAAGPRDFRNRLDTNVIAVIPVKPSTTVRIARVQYAGQWDPEPYAWTRFARWFRGQTGYALDVQSVSMPELDPAIYPFAHLTGNARYIAASDEIAAVKSYVERGGVLLIDMTGGSGEFAETIRGTLLGSAFPTINPSILRATHPLLQPGAPGMEDLSRPKLRPFAVERVGSNGGVFDVYAAGKGHVVFTNLDITSGLLNTRTWGIVGYDPIYAQSFLKNAIFWTLDGQKDR